MRLWTTTRVCARKSFPALRSQFEVLEGEDYDEAVKLLQEEALDVLLLGLPIESGGVRECTELLGRLDGSNIDTLVIVLSSDEKKSTALKVIDAGVIRLFHQADRYGRAAAPARARR